jgi:hypothetical protein
LILRIYEAGFSYILDQSNAGYFPGNSGISGVDFSCVLIPVRLGTFNFLVIVRISEAAFGNILILGRLVIP